MLVGTAGTAAVSVFSILFFLNRFIWPGLLFLVTLLFLPRGRKVGYRHIPLRATTPNILATTL